MKTEVVVVNETIEVVFGNRRIELSRIEAILLRAQLYSAIWEIEKPRLVRKLAELEAQRLVAA